MKKTYAAIKNILSNVRSNMYIGSALSDDKKTINKNSGRTLSNDCHIDGHKKVFNKYSGKCFYIPEELASKNDESGDDLN